MQGPEGCDATQTRAQVRNLFQKTRESPHCHRNDRPPGNPVPCMCIVQLKTLHGHLIAIEVRTADPLQPRLLNGDNRATACQIPLHFRLAAIRRRSETDPRTLSGHEIVCQMCFGDSPNQRFFAILHPAREKTLDARVVANMKKRPHRPVSSLLFCPPAASKLSGASQRSYSARNAGHSLSIIENHAVSRLSPLMIRSCRNRPSY